MAFFFQQIVAARFIPNSNTTLFTGPVNSIVRIDALTVTNVDAAAQTVTIHLVPSGGSVASSNTTTFTQQIQPGQCWVSPNEIGKVLGAGDFLSAIASASNTLVISAAGIVQA